MRIVTHGATDQSIELFIVDSDGLPATGLAYNSSGIDLWYRRNGAAVTSITEATQTANGAHSDGGFVGLGNGVYRLDPPDAAFASGVSHVTFGGTITGYTVYPVTVQLTAFDLQTATQAVNVTQFGGSNGTFASGRPEVNATHWGGTAVASANVRADVRQFLGSAITEASASNIATNFSTFWNNEDATGDTLLSHVTDIKTRTDRIPNIAAGAAGGIVIAGSNAATTFETLTVTGAMSIDGTGNVAQTGDSYARLGAPAGASIAADIAGIGGGGGGGVSWADLVADNDDVAGSFGKAIADILVDTGTSLPDQIADLDTAPTYPPRMNFPPSPGFTTQVSRRADGTYKCTKPIRLTAGDVENVYVFIDMSPLFGANDFVSEVGTAVVSAGSITQGDDNGPRDTYAVVELSGTADDACEVTVPVTMTSGTTVDVVFDVEVLG